MPRQAEYPGIEVFYSRRKDQTSETCFWNEDDDEPRGTGWYAWNCQPGCLPDSDPIGPFESEAAAWAEAIDFFDLESEEEVDDEGEPVDPDDDAEVVEHAGEDEDGLPIQARRFWA